MSTLPSFRVEQGNPPFSRSGVDFFGPIYVKQKRSRVKRWSWIFVCMSVWAVHIQLTESLDSDSFINAMQRFINRRKCPSLILLDCGILKVQLMTLRLRHQSLITVKLAMKWLIRKFNGCLIHPLHCTWEDRGKEWFERSRKLFMVLSRIES